MTVALTALTKEQYHSLGISYEFRVISSSSQRIFMICQDCKAKRAIDYTVEVLEHTWQGRKYQHPVVYRLDAQGNPIARHGDSALGRCDGCGSWSVKIRELKHIVVSESHGCDGRCEMATSEKCECSCGGTNHGRAHLVH